jgi:hypothetical protein
MDIGELRRRIGRELDLAKREAGERRRAADDGRAAYQRFLNEIAAPLAKQIVTVLRAEGHPFTSFTPLESVRLASDRASDDFIEIELDTSAHSPQVVGRTSLTRGRKGVVVEERPIGPHKAIEALTEEDLVAFLLPELRRLILRG